MGMGFENCKVGFGKKNELGNGIGIPPLHSGLSQLNVWYQAHSGYQNQLSEEAQDQDEQRKGVAKAHAFSNLPRGRND